MSIVPTPLVSLLSPFRPSVQTPALVLGNCLQDGQLASQLASSSFAWWWDTYNVDGLDDEGTCEHDNYDEVSLLLTSLRCLDLNSILIYKEEVFIGEATELVVVWEVVSIRVAL